ncbi:hypothetical protein [Deinococcus maricopensis]|uniref:Uncharacterized protein n=1 Tax=Deinococcus maricopensis (strain DSM 21211 / LMG 22137 / NRRL B-23946 / LB-34) TaxID=709986 RepID=E8U6S7_DEIML|nr:hypothetical protein [Deinococcus maricopensis]ADV66766.1 hypothetical protein Deima_1114 [Deinococcus maricopensis DSM 21211]
MTSAPPDDAFNHADAPERPTPAPTPDTVDDVAVHAQRYEAALPVPDALDAAQFMPVLAPTHFSALLDDLTGQLPLIPDEAARSVLTTRARLLRLNVEQYRVHHHTTQQTLNRILAETGVGVRDAWARQQEHLQFMNAASSSVEREYAAASDAIEHAKRQRFEMITLYGATPDTRDAEAFYQQLALGQLAQEGHPIRPPEQRSGSKRVFNAFAVFSKFFVGLLSGVSINLLFNPESRLYLTLIALAAGVMFSVLLLWLVDELAYRAKLAQRTPGMARPWTYVTGIVLVSALYLGVEGYLNWDGILRVTQEIAANAAQQGQLTDLSSDAGAAGVPQHWSLLAFTLALVSMAVGASLLQGRERARTVLERERLAARVAQLKLGQQFTEAARTTDLVKYLEEERARLAPPRDVTSPDHARLNERVLSHWEQERDAHVQTLGGRIVQDAQHLQASLEAFAEQVLQARHPKPRRGLTGWVRGGELRS